MASVQEIKDTLLDSQAEAIAMSERSLDAIDTIVNVANFWLTLLTILIAIVSLIGFGVIYIGGQRLARRIAEQRIKDYIENNEGKAAVRLAISEEVAAQLERRTFVMVHPEPPQPDEPSFAKDPKQTGGRT